jgi:hypothetical protein
MVRVPRYTRQTAVEDYLKPYPKIADRWINRCVACGCVGYKPDMPDEARRAHFLKHELAPLPLDDLGRCDNCAATNRYFAKPS